MKILRQRSYQRKYTGSRPITEVKCVTSRLTVSEYSEVNTRARSVKYKPECSGSAPARGSSGGSGEYAVQTREIAKKLVTLTLVVVSYDKLE